MSILTKFLFVGTPIFFETVFPFKAQIESVVKETIESLLVPDTGVSFSPHAHPPTSITITTPTTSILGTIS